MCVNVLPLRAGGALGIGYGDGLRLASEALFDTEKMQGNLSEGILRAPIMSNSIA